MEPLSASDIEAAFRELSRELRFSGTKARLYVIGGAAIALAWNEDWLNDMATSAVPRGPDSMSRTVYVDSNLVVGAASAKHLLAMKLRAAREKDADDIAFLTRHLGVADVKQAWDFHDDVFPGDPPLPLDYAKAMNIMANIWPYDRSMESDNRYGYRQAKGKDRGGMSR